MVIPTTAPGQEIPTGLENTIPTGLNGLGANWVIDSSTGAAVDCDLWSNITNFTCWNPFAQSTSAPQSTNYGGASNPSAAMAAMTPAQQAQYNANQAVIDAGDQQIANTLSPGGLLNPLTGAPGCTSTKITGVCDSTIQTLETVGVAAAVILGAMLITSLRK